MACGTCDFFWPKDLKTQPYGPYASYDFDVNVPFAAPPGKGSGPQPWVRGRTAPSVFPNAAVAGGCRKAPIMTIGINPNMTVFSPGQTGTAWAYPNFTSDNGTDAWTNTHGIPLPHRDAGTVDLVLEAVHPPRGAGHRRAQRAHRFRRAAHEQSRVT